MNTKALSKLGTIISNNSPTILTGVAVAGLVSTVIMAVKATPKALQILGEEQAYRKSEGITKEFEVIPARDVVKLTWKCYAPAAVLGGVTIACIIGANSVNLKRNAALATVYSLSEAALKEYKAKVVETIGEKKERDIRDSIAQDKLRRNPVDEEHIFLTGKGDTLCYDAFSGRYFKSDREYIRQAINTVRRIQLSEMFIRLNDIYYQLGLRSIELGDLVGWHIDDGDLEPHFSSHIADNGQPCLVMDFNLEPQFGFKD